MHAPGSNLGVASKMFLFILRNKCTHCGCSRDEHDVGKPEADQEVPKVSADDQLIYKPISVSRENCTFFLKNVASHFACMRADTETVY